MNLTAHSMTSGGAHLAAAAAPATLDRRDWIAGLEKGLAIIEVFDAEHARLTASEAGQRCGMTRTAARRYLLTLAHLGYVMHDGKHFWLTPRVLRLGQAYLDSARLPRSVQPYLQRVTAGTGEIAYVAVLDGDEVIYIARTGTHRHLHTGYGQGTRVQAQVTAAGMAILAMQDPAVTDAWIDQRPLRAFTSHTIASTERLKAELARVREQGWALSEQQLELNYRGIAVPLYDRFNALLGAVNISMPMNHESSEDAVARVLPVLQETARSLRNVL